MSTHQKCPYDHHECDVEEIYFAPCNGILAVCAVAPERGTKSGIMVGKIENMLGQVGPLDNTPDLHGTFFFYQSSDIIKKRRRKLQVLAG